MNHLLAISSRLSAHCSSRSACSRTDELRREARRTQRLYSPETWNSKNMLRVFSIRLLCWIRQWWVLKNKKKYGETRNPLWLCIYCSRLPASLYESTQRISLSKHWDSDSPPRLSETNVGSWGSYHQGFRFGKSMPVNLLEIWKIARGSGE